MKRLLTLLVGAAIMASCKCPKLADTKITVSNSDPFIGSRTILSAPHQYKSTVYWTGPGGTTHIGDSWVLDTITMAMSGTYEAYTVYKNRFKCATPVTSVPITVHDCQPYPQPVITAQSNVMNAGTAFSLSVPFISDAQVVWQGPKGRYEGNPLVLNDVTPDMAGDYTAQYVHRYLAHCNSTPGKKHLEVLQRDTVVKFMGKPYYVEFLYNKNEVDVWLRAEKTGESVKDIFAANVRLEFRTIKEMKEAFPTSLDKVNDHIAVMGCATFAGAAGCAFGSVETGGLLLPVCEIFVANSEPAMAACLEGIAGKIASALEKDKEWTIGSTGASIAEKDIKGAVLGMLQMMTLIKQGDTPIVQNGTITAKPRPTPPPSGGSNGNDERKGPAGSTGGGQGNTNRSGGGNSGGNNKPGGGGNSGSGKDIGRQGPIIPRKG